MQTIRGAIEAARSDGRCALIPYITLGHPSLEASLTVLTALEEMGCDVVEVGIPFSDPVADGPTIQHSIEVALWRGIHLGQCLEVLSDVKQQSPRLLFSYFNPLLRFGLEPLVAQLPRSQVQGVLVTDLVPEEAGDWLEIARTASIETCFLVTATSSEARLSRAVQSSSGFVYCVSTLGVTGPRSKVDSRARETVVRLRSVTDIPVAVGFGVSGAHDVEQIREYADGVVVGSALVGAIGDGTDVPAAVARAQDFIGPLLEAAHQ
jgi:tryptophan synthase alpha chain